MTQPFDTLQAVAWYPPYQLGGTEVYLSGLIASLAERGVRSGVLVPRAAGAPERYEHQGVAVLTYAPIAQGAPASLAAFEALLRAHPARIYNQHSWTPDCSLDHLRAAHRVGMKTVLTVHVPNIVCLRGTMMRFGREACDGFVDEVVCAACRGQERGAPEWVATALAHMPAVLEEAGRRLPGRIGTALSGRSIARQRRADLTETVEAADRIVAVCQWLYDAILKNGAPAAKLSMSRQGVSRAFCDEAAAAAAGRTVAVDGMLRLLYLGRWHPVKGIDVVVRALRLRPDLQVRLTIHALDSGAEEAAYRREIEALAAGDPRILIHPPLARSAIAATMAEHDLLVVPSVCLETGPLVALEAQAVGLPVLGSRLGGLIELIDSDDKGRLAPPGDPTAWADALQALIAQPFDRTAMQPKSVRSMDEAAADMASLYHDLG